MTLFLTHRITAPTQQQQPDHVNVVLNEASQIHAPRDTGKKPNTCWTTRNLVRLWLVKRSTCPTIFIHAAFPPTLDALKRAREQGKQEPVFSLPSTTPQSQQDTPDATQSLPTASTNTFNMSPTLFPPSDPLFNLNFDHSYSFDSTAANMEYSMLSAILGNPSAQEDANHIPPSPPPSTNLPLISNPAWPNIPLGGQSYNNFANGLNGTKLDGKDGYLDPALAQQTGSEQQLSAGINPSSALQFRISDNTFTPLTPPASDPTPASPSLINLSPDIQAKLPPGEAASPIKTLCHQRLGYRTYTISVLSAF